MALTVQSFYVLYIQKKNLIRFNAITRGAVYTPTSAKTRMAHLIQLRFLCVDCPILPNYHRKAWWY